jgi:nucleoside-diphosphate-sugar epimerase
MELDLSFFDNKRILITGGGGYLGSKLAEVLVGANAKIYLMDINYNEIAENLIEEKSHVIKLLCNITIKHELETSIKISQPEVIFHFAALLNRERDFSNYGQLYQVNVEVTFNLLEALKHQPYIGLYFTSSSEVYGSFNPSPFREDQYPLPSSPYSLTKLMAENVISTYSQIYDKPYTILRLFNFYGPMMPRSFFLSQLDYALNNDIPFDMTEGEQKRDFLHIADLMVMLLRVVMKDKSNGQIINLCSGTGVPIRTIAEKRADEFNKKHLLRIGAIPYRTNEVWEMIGDNTKIKLLLE